MNMVDEVETVAEGDAAAELTHQWIGLPMFGDARPPARLVISFETEEERAEFLKIVGVKTIHKGTRGTQSVWYPEKPREDLSSLRFVVEEIPGVRRGE